MTEWNRSPSPEDDTTGQTDWPGLVNQPITGDYAVTRNVQPANSAFADLTAIQILALISREISSLIQDTQEVIGRNITTDMCVMLPPAQYDLLSHVYVGDNAERTLFRQLMEDNPWTNRTGNALMIESVIELDSSRGHVSSDRMITTVKHQYIAEFPVAFEPRLIRVEEQGYGICAPVEAKFGYFWLKRPTIMRYRDGHLMPRWVEINQNGEWLPFLVTHDHGNGVLSGVGFTGIPARVGWPRRGTEAFNSVVPGGSNRQWRELPGEAFGNVVSVESEEDGKPEVPLLDRLVEAIGDLDPDDKELWTAAGVPKVEAIEEVLGQDITGPQRDEAWKAYQEANAGG